MALLIDPPCVLNGLSQGHMIGKLLSSDIESKLVTMLVSVAVFLVALTLPVMSKIHDPPPYKEYYFEQTLDHFNFFPDKYGKSTYQQRYLVQGK